MTEVKVTMDDKVRLQRLSRRASVFLVNIGFILADEDWEQLDPDQVISSGEIHLLTTSRNKRNERYYVGMLEVKLDEPWVFHLFGEGWLENARTLAVNLAFEFGSEIMVNLEDAELRTEYDEYYRPDGSDELSSGSFAAGCAILVIIIVAAALIWNKDEVVRFLESF